MREEKNKSYPYRVRGNARKKLSIFRQNIKNNNNVHIQILHSNSLQLATRCVQFFFYNFICQAWH